MNFLKKRTLAESTFVLFATVFFSLFVVLLGSLALKFQVAVVVGMVGLVGIMLFPAKRILLICLWILIQPLSIEKIVYVAPPIWDGLEGIGLAINVADVLLMLVFVILIYQSFIKRHSVFIFDKTTQLFFLLLAWGLASYLIHLAFYQSSFVGSAPLGLLDLLRDFLFVVTISAAIQSRSDLMWVLVSLSVVIFVQSVLVMLSYSTGQAYNFLTLIGIPTELQQYSTGSEVVSRGSGTVGLPNSQAIFHTAYTFIIFGLLAVRNSLFRWLGLLAILISFIAIIFTFSRGAWLSMAVGVMLIVLLFIKRGEVTPKAWLMGGLIAILFVVILAALAEPMINRLTKGDDGATGSRVRMIMLAKDLAMQYPIIGVGPGDYMEAGLHLYPPGEKQTEWVPLGDKAIVPPLGRIELVRSFAPGKKTLSLALPVHNKYMLTVAEMGFVGLLLWLLILKNFFSEAKRCAFSNDGLYRFVGVAGLATTVALALYMMLDLFYGYKIMQIVLFPMLLTSAAYRISKMNG